MLINFKESVMIYNLNKVIVFIAIITILPLRVVFAESVLVELPSGEIVEGRLVESEANSATVASDNYESSIWSESKSFYEDLFSSAQEYLEDRNNSELLSEDQEYIGEDFDSNYGIDVKEWQENWKASLGDGQSNIYSEQYIQQFQGAGQDFVNKWDIKFPTFGEVQDGVRNNFANQKNIGEIALMLTDMLYDFQEMADKLLVKQGLSSKEVEGYLKNYMSMIGRFINNMDSGSMSGMQLTSIVQQLTSPLSLLSSQLHSSNNPNALSYDDALRPILNSVGQFAEQVSSLAASDSSKNNNFSKIWSETVEAN